MIANAAGISGILGNMRTTTPLDAQQQELIRKSFLWLFVAIIAFAAFQFVLFQTGIAAMLAALVFSFGRIGWLGILGGFILVGTLSTKLAHHDDRKMQFVGYFAYIICEGLIFVPLLYVAQATNTTIIPASAAVTFLITGALCTVVIATRSNFSFLTPFLTAGAVGALGLIVCSAFMGFNLGLLFSFAMVLLACGYILLTTSRILHEYSSHHYIGAATELFAAVALLFWYVVRIGIDLSGRLRQ